MDRFEDDRIFTTERSSESEMAPNAEEELLVVKPWGPQPEKERLRPPTYNAEDYAVALRRWGRRPQGATQDSQGTLPSTTSSSSGYASGSGEMTLRQFTSVSELLNKLRADLRLAFPSFVQEFASPPADGITLLLETLRGVQLAQSSPPSGQHGPRIGTRRAALDELGCVECLAACGERCTDAARLLVQAQPGLLALAVCLTSSLNRSRVLALQLLTKVCQTSGGHAAVSEAVSTLRLRYGEGGRFRFLAGALLAPRAAIALRVAGISFLNAFLKSAPRAQARLYIQAEACEAGLEPKALQEWLTEIDGGEEDTLTDLLHKEVQRWTHNCVDVEALQKRAARAEETCRALSKKISALQSQLQKQQLENVRNYNLEDMEKMKNSQKTQKVSSNAEDEGISSSERSSSPEDLKHGQGHVKVSIVDNDQETTIDDVIEELRIIVKDAEEEFEDQNALARNSADTVNSGENKCSPLFTSGSKLSLNSQAKTFLYDEIDSKSSSRFKDEDSKVTGSSAGQNCTENPITYFGATDKECSSSEGSVKILVKGPEVEDAIVPAILHPQPPRRTPPCLSAILAARDSSFVDVEEEEIYNSHDEEVEEETLGDGSDSLLSASRLKYTSGKDQETEIRKTALINERPNKNIENRLKDNKFTKSFDNIHDMANVRRDKKTIRNYEVSSKSKFDQIISRQMESRYSKDYGPSGEVQRHNTKYRSEVEKRKLLRRAASHDFLDSEASSPSLRRTGSRVEGRIRKFESLTSFDNASLHSFARHGSTDNISKIDQPQQSWSEGSRSRIRRSESLHHVSHAVTKKDHGSSRGGSDSGLFYVTDFDLEPLVGRRLKSDSSKSPSLLTKSLDRIDEGLDSMVDIVITEEKQHWELNRRFAKDRKRTGRERSSRELNNNKLYGQIKSDELYGEERHHRWNHEDIDGNKKVDPTVFINRNGSRHEPFRYEKSANKFSTRSTESGIFLPCGRPSDAFGWSKSRFNAGKYSGNNIPRENNVRNSGYGGKIGGKVTDVISGLY
ncbi:uncharacterized protein LOC107265618 isoform X2 [Cephus cinctus]|uniref:Uncharacterized protein LOC107265618 isoform X2 n=1 Tax=Cephus cinctus TaxID=211228 RepID=A0AAJ7FGI9_CEPCN|nr:uncharacterized protein LOC107265618 isoform X2 [Cephus cinctus]